MASGKPVNQQDGGDLDTDLTCNACQFAVTSVEQRGVHYKSEWHRYNVKRRCAGLAPLPQDVFEQKLTALEEKKKQANPDRVKAKCKLCNKFFQSDAAFKQHLNTKSHLKKERKPVAASPAMSSVAGSEPPSPHPSLGAAQAADNKEEEDGDDGAGVLDETADEESVQGDGEGKKKGPLREPIPLGTCLFCSKRFGNNLEGQLTHMLKYHGFFIPFIEYLEDAEGFLLYLGAKIGEGCVCIYCNGRGRANYPSLHAVQEHMRAKSHCKIRFDEEEDQEEYLDFFKFPGDIGTVLEEGEGEEGEDEEEEEEEEAAAAPTSKGKKQSKGKGIDKDEIAAALAGMDEGEEEGEGEEKSARNTQLVSLDGIAKKRHLHGMNEGGELVLSDGSVVGHRSLRSAYKLHVRAQDTRDSVMLARMQSSYRQLAVPGYTQKSKQSERTLMVHKLYQHQMMKNGMAFNSYGRLRRVSQNS